MHILEIIFAFECGIRQMYNFQSSKHFVTLWKACKFPIQVEGF